MAPGDGRWSNRTWETDPGFQTEGEWSHLAVNFTEDGVFVYVDGKLVPDGAWTASKAIRRRRASIRKPTSP